MLTRFAGIVLACVIGGCRGAEGAPSPSVSRTTIPAESRATAESTTVAPLGYGRGRDDAPILVVEFTDFGCHYCAEFANDVLPQVNREFLTPGAVRWRLVPLATASTPHALEAAAATICAAEDDKVWPMHDRLFARQREWARFGDPTAHFIRYAHDLGIDEKRFRSCLGDPETARDVASLRALVHQLGVRVAPTFFVSGRRVEGALPIEGMRAVITGALQRP